MCDTFCREKIFSSALVWYLEIQHMLLCLEKSWVAVISSLGKVISPVASPGRACRKSWGTMLSCLEKIRCRIPTPSRPHPRLWPTELRCLLWSQLLGESRLEKSPLVVSLCVTYFLICFSSSRPWGVVWIFFIRYRETRFWKKNLPRLLGVDVRCHTSGLRKNNLPVVCR